MPISSRLHICNQPRWKISIFSINFPSGLKIRLLWYPTAFGNPLPVVFYHIFVESYHIFTYIISLDGKIGSCGIPLSVVSHCLWYPTVCGIPLSVVSYHIRIYIISRDGKSSSFPSIFHLSWKFCSCVSPLPVGTYCLWYPIIYAYI